MQPALPLPKLVLTRAGRSCPRQLQLDLYGATIALAQYGLGGQVTQGIASGMHGGQDLQTEAALLYPGGQEAKFAAGAKTGHVAGQRAAHHDLPHFSSLSCLRMPGAWGS